MIADPFAEVEMVIGYKKTRPERVGLFQTVRIRSPDYSATTGTTETSFLVKFPNWTVPSVSAKSV